MRTKTLLMAAVMFLVLSAAAFAQATYTVGSIPVTAVINTGQTERTGDVTFTQLSGTSLDGTITISYGVPITVPFANVHVTGTGGLAGAAVNAASSNSGGQLVITIPAGGGLNATITVTGVRVAVAGSSFTSLTASISAVGNAIVAGQTNVIVINNILPGIAGVMTGNSATVGSINAVTPNPITTQPTLTVKEGFLSAWGGAAEAGNTTALNIRITLSAAPPSGVKITFPATAATSSTGIFTTVNADQTALGTDVTFDSSSTSLSVYYKVATDTNNAVQETLLIPLVLSVSSSATLPLPSTTITFLATLAPIGNAFASNGSVLSTPIPRYAQSDIGPGTVFNIVGRTTTLLVPFAQAISGYDTGFAVANTTEDPGKSKMGFAAAIPQTGPITFYFFPAFPATTNFSYVTAAGSPGGGLDASGNLPSGSTYTVLLSQLLAAAGQPATFSGYVVMVTNFTDAHCLFVVSNFTTFSQGALALVIPSDRTASVESLNN